MNISDISPDIDLKTIKQIQTERVQWLKRTSVQKYKEAVRTISKYKTPHLDFTSETVRIGRSDEISEIEKEVLSHALRVFMPWRKGPFNIFGIDIDAEWKSNRKWSRLLEHLPPLENKVIADIGCSNGYYMFRMLPRKPKLIVGFDPTLLYYYTFQALNSLAKIKTIQYELLGVEHFHLYRHAFDVVFLMGILYHHPSPVEILKSVKDGMKPGGTLIIETQGIPGNEPVALFPEKRYAKVPGTYFVPTAKCLENFVKRAGFREVEIFHTHKMSSEEQRKTDWMVYESYEDFLDQTNPELTVEGYPAPIRIYLKCRKIL